MVAGGAVYFSRPKCPHCGKRGGVTVTETSRIEPGCNSPQDDGYTVNTWECSNCGHCDNDHRNKPTRASHAWSSRTRTITAPTTCAPGGSGQDEVTHTCRKCNKVEVSYRTTHMSHDWGWGSTRTIYAATYDHGGKEETTKTCRRCGKVDVTVSSPV